MKTICLFALGLCYLSAGYLAAEEPQRTFRRVELRLATDKEEQGYFKSYNTNQAKDIYVASHRLLDSSEIKDAKVNSYKSKIAEPGAKWETNYQVLVTFTKKGGEKFRVISATNIGRRIAIFFDGKVIAAPRILEKMPENEIAISGNFTEQEAKEIVSALKSK